jgi:hypothetical protein
MVVPVWMILPLARQLLPDNQNFLLNILQAGRSPAFLLTIKLAQGWRDAFLLRVIRSAAEYSPLHLQKSG